MKEKRSRKKMSLFDQYIEEIQEYVNIGLSFTAIYKLISRKMDKKLQLSSFYEFAKSRKIKN